MTAPYTEQRADAALSAEILAHLDTQLVSAHRLEQIVLEQAGAIRKRAVPEVVRLAGLLQAEVHHRQLIELERERLAQRAAQTLGVPADQVTIAMLADVMDGASAEIARARATELRSLLEQIQREHATNRALMRQELAFLDHLLRLAGAPGSYDATGEPVSARRHAPLMRRPVFELEV